MRDLLSRAGQKVASAFCEEKNKVVHNFASLQTSANFKSSKKKPLQKLSCLWEHHDIASAQSHPMGILFSLGFGSSRPHCYPERHLVIGWQITRGTPLEQQRLSRSAQRSLHEMGVGGLSAPLACWGACVLLEVCTEGEKFVCLVLL